MYTHVPTDLAYFRININDLTMFVTWALYCNKLPNLLFHDEMNAEFWNIGICYKKHFHLERVSINFLII